MASGERCRQGWTDCSGCLVLTPGAEEAETGKILSVLKHMLHSKNKKIKTPHNIQFLLHILFSPCWSWQAWAVLEGAEQWWLQKREAEAEVAEQLPIWGCSGLKCHVG